MTPSDLERRVHEALRRLPAPQAPRSLTPRVMAAVRVRRQAAWYARPMRTWPVGLQAAAAGLALALMVLLAVWLRWGMPATAAWSALLPSGARQLVEPAAAMLVLWRVLVGPVLVYAATFAVAVGCVFAVCAAALTRVVLGRVPAQAG